MIEKKFVLEIPNEDRPLERAKALKAIGEFKKGGSLGESLEDLQHHLNGKDVKYDLYFEVIENIENEDLEKAMGDG